MELNKKTKPRALLKSLAPHVKEEIIKYLKTYGATKSNTPDLYKAIGKKSYRGLEDAFRYLEEVEDLLIQEKIGRAKAWRLKDKDLISQELSKKDLINLKYAIELNKDEFDETTLKSIQKIFSSNQSHLSGHLGQYEELENPKVNDYYKELTEAITKRLYLKLRFSHDIEEKYENVKPIQIVFLDNNWYIAFEYQNNKDKKFVMRRLAFIKEIKILKESKYSDKITFQSKELEPYLEFLKNVQNAMTLYGVEPKVATIKATPLVAKYFGDGMKKFLPSQMFKSKEADGSVIFTLAYTQELEILPFIQKWLPDLVILEPKELRDEYKKKLETALAEYE